MSKDKLFFMGMVGVLLFGGLAQASVVSEPMPVVNHVSGEITWVDVKLGRLQLSNEAPSGDRSVTEYRMNQQATNVTDPSDQKFLTLEDLRPGQRVVIEFEPANSQGELMVRKITVEPALDPQFQEAFGELEAIDVNAGTLVLEERPVARREGGQGNLSYFLFEPREIVVMRSPSRQPVRLELNPGDPLRIEFVVKDGKRWAHSITSYSALPVLVEQTTTTTTTTSVTTTQ